MKNSFNEENNENRKLNNVEYDIERMRNEFGKGMGIEEIADKLNLDRDYAEFLFWFGIV